MRNSFRIFLSIIYVSVLFATIANAASLEWWDTDYEFRRPIIIIPQGSPVPSGYSMSVSLDHELLVMSGRSMHDGSDLRIVHWSGDDWLEIDRVLDPESEFDSSGTELWFALVGDLTPVNADSSYYVYYGNAAAGIPPEDESTVFPFADFFDRPSSDFVGNNWLVVEGTGDLDIASGSLFFNRTDNQENRPVADHDLVAHHGTLAWHVGFDWERTGSDTGYRLHLQLGDSMEMDIPPAESSAFSNAGIGPSLVWASPSEGMFNHEGFGYEVGGLTQQLGVVSGVVGIEVLANIPDNVFDVFIDGSLVAENLPFTSSVASLDRMRILCWGMNEESFARRHFRHTYIREVVTPSPSSSIGSEESSVSDVVPGRAGLVTLYDNFPNPFNPRTVIAFELPEKRQVRLRVFDMRGRAVRSLVREFMEGPGRREVIWDGTDDLGQGVAGGVYFYRLEAGSYSETKRMVLVK